MALTEAKLEELAQFVQRYCAVDGSSTDEPRDGYFAFYAGRTARRVTVSRRKVNVPRDAATPQAALALILPRVRDVISSGEGHCWVRWYYTGESAHDEQVFVEGVLAGEDEDAEAMVNDGSAVGALVAAVLVRARMDANRIGDLERRLDQQAMQISEGREQLTLAAVAGDLWRVTAQQGQTAAMMREMVPVIRDALPFVLAMVAKSMGHDVKVPAAPPPKAEPVQGSAQPETPEGHIEALVALIGAAAADLFAVCAAHPEAMGDRLAPLREVAEGVLGFLRGPQRPRGRKS